MAYKNSKPLGCSQAIPRAAEGEGVAPGMGQGTGGGGTCVDPNLISKRGLGLGKGETQAGELPQILTGGQAASPPGIL